MADGEMSPDGDVKMDLEGEKKKPAPPQIVHLRWSKVLNKHVLCLESDHDAIPYKMVHSHLVK